LCEQAVRFGLHVLAPAEVANRRGADDDGDRDDAGGFAAARFDRVARLDGKSAEFVFFEVLAFCSLHT
jgi:hypothetical protein